MSSNSKSVLKNRTYKREIVDKIKQNFGCYICGENEPACIDFHHINGKDMSISKMLETHKSLRSILNEIKRCAPLCANCHRKVHKGIIEIKGFNNEQWLTDIEVYYAEKDKYINKCVDCQQQIETRAYRCRPCANKHSWKIDWPDHAILCYYIFEYGYEATGRMYGVTGNSIKKRYFKHCN